MLPALNPVATPSGLKKNDPSRKKMGRPGRWSVMRMTQLGKELVAYLKAHEDCLSIEEFCGHRSQPIDARRLENTFDVPRYENFSEQYACARDILIGRWIKGAAIRNQATGKDGTQLQTKLDPCFAQFMLNSRFGLHAKTEEEGKSAIFGNGLRIVVDGEEKASKLGNEPL